MDAKKIARAIMEYLDNMDIEFQILEKDAMLLFRTEEEDLSDASPVVYCIIAIEDSMYTVYTTSSDLSDSDAVMGAIRDVSELVVRANWYCTPGHFDLNEDTGDIRYRNCVYCNAVPDDESIQDNIGIAIEEINAFSDDLRKVIQHHRTPRDVINQVQMNMRRVAVENDFVHFLIHQIEEAEEEEKVELIVFAAASMTETLTEIKDLYEEANPGVTIVYNFDSSGTLKTQIQEGADCDLFISAAQKQMNQLDASCDEKNNPDGLDFVLQGSRIDLLENKVGLVVPEGNPKGIESFEQLAGLLKVGDVFMAMGNSDVPVGQYTQKILAYFELEEEALADALKTGKVRAAGLDVLKEEPPVHGSPLLEAPHAVVTGHIAWLTKESRLRAVDMAIENFIHYLNAIPTSVIN